MITKILAKILLCGLLLLIQLVRADAASIQRLRAANFSPTVTRLVVETDAPVVLGGEPLLQGDRLIIPVAADAHSQSLVQGQSFDRLIALKSYQLAPWPTDPMAGDSPPVSGVALTLTLPAGGRLLRSFTLPAVAPKTPDRLVIDLTIDAVKPAKAEPAQPPPPRPPPPVVVLDPGHGGQDPGTTSPDGVQEKTVTLAVGLAMKQYLEEGGRYSVVMTRASDYFLPLRDRIALARDAKADLFISLHADANPNPKVQGLSVYTLSDQASDAEASKLAAKENKADVLAGVDLTAEVPEVSNILIDLARRETRNSSLRLAKLLVASLSTNIKLLKHGERAAGFAVLKLPDTPSVLIELGHLSNPQEAMRLQDPAYQQQLAAAIGQAVDRFFAR